MAMGRVRECCYDKVIDFRFIDLGDPKIGLSSTNQMDHVVCIEFFDQENQGLQTEALKSVQAALAGFKRGSSSQDRLQDFGKTPDDNPAKLLTKW